MKVLREADQATSPVDCVLIVSQESQSMCSPGGESVSFKHIHAKSFRLDALMEVVAYGKTTIWV